MTWMFVATTAFNQDISTWDVSRVESHQDFAANSLLGVDNHPMFKL